MREKEKITFFSDGGEKFFGEGPYMLLLGVEKTGSLHKTAEETGISWAKACRIIRECERVLGFPLLERRTGGRGGGGSALTVPGREWVRKYTAYREALSREGERLFQTFYPEYSSGLVIMASGTGTRFGGNKLMAPFLGEPLIGRILSATDSLFRVRTAVTRSPETCEYLRNAGVDTVFHDLPGRNDTVRLGLLRVMEKEVPGCMFCPADQPLLRHETVRRLLQKTAEEPERIWRLSTETSPGAPVWFPRCYFPELLSLPDGKGGGAVIAGHPDDVRCFAAEDPLELSDADTKEDLEFLEKTVCTSPSGGRHLTEKDYI